MMVAWGAHKKRLSKDYSNVFYLEDRYSHAKCHNELIKANKIMILGGTMDAFRTASSVRSYLDSINYQKTEVILMFEGNSEIRNNMGKQVSDAITKMMRDQNITVIDECKVSHIIGDYKIDKIHFKRGLSDSEYAEKIWSKQGATDYYIRPDMVIVENGVGEPKQDLAALVGNEDEGNLNNLTFTKLKLPISNVRFSLY